MYVVFIVSMMYDRYTTYIAMQENVMSYSEKKLEYNLEYSKKHYKRVPLDLTIEKYEEAKKAAEMAGEPLNRYIKNAIDRRIESGT